MLNVLITDDCHPFLIKGLEDAGLNVDFLPHLSLDEIDSILFSYEGVVINTRTKMDSDRIDKAPNLKFIARMGSGLDIIDLPHAAGRGIDVISSPEGNAGAVAEHSLAMLLSLLNKLPLGMEMVKNNAWKRERARGKELSGKTFGIIGYGHTGPALAELLSGFRMKVKIFDKYKMVEPIQYSSTTIVPADFDEVIETSDFISFNIPLTDETAFLVDESLIDKMKTGVVLINASRGKVTSLKAILYGLHSAKLSGVCLDVFPNEKTDTFTDEESAIMAELAEHPSVVLTPHVAGWTIESKEKIAQILVEKIKKNILTN